MPRRTYLVIFQKCGLAPVLMQSTCTCHVNSVRLVGCAGTSPRRHPTLVSGCCANLDSIECFSSVGARHGRAVDHVASSACSATPCRGCELLRTSTTLAVYLHWLDSNSGSLCIQYPFHVPACHALVLLSIAHKRNASRRGKFAGQTCIEWRTRRRWHDMVDVNTFGDSSDTMRMGTVSVLLQACKRS